MTAGLNEGKSAVIYARVSTKGQADSGASIETQLKVCRKWCVSEGVIIVGEYHDDGVSGTTTDRDSFASLIGSVVSKEPDFLVVYDSSRITREGNDKYEKLKVILNSLRCSIIYAGLGGMSADSQAALYMDSYKSTSDSLMVKESTKKTRETVNRLISEGKHVSRAAGFVFAEDIPNMPDGRVLYEPKEREKKDPEGRIVKSVTKATVVRSVSDFFALVDRGASIEVIAEMWGIGRHSLAEAVKGKTHCKKEKCPIPDRYPEYLARLEKAKENGSSDPLFEPYRRSIRARAAKEREQCRKAMESRVAGNKGSDNPQIEAV